MIQKKTTTEIEILKEAGSILAGILKELATVAIPGNTTLDIDDRAMELAEKYNVVPVLLGYHPEFTDRPFPAAICVSVNDCVQHGIPSKEIVLKEGDTVNIDMSLSYKNMVVE